MFKLYGMDKENEREGFNLKYEFYQTYNQFYSPQNSQEEIQTVVKSPKHSKSNQVSTTNISRKIINCGQTCYPQSSSNNEWAYDIASFDKKVKMPSNSNKSNNNQTFNYPYQDQPQSYMNA